MVQNAKNVRSAAVVYQNHRSHNRERERERERVLRDGTLDGWDSKVTNVTCWLWFGYRCRQLLAILCPSLWLIIHILPGTVENCRSWFSSRGSNRYPQTHDHDRCVVQYFKSAAQLAICQLVVNLSVCLLYTGSKISAFVHNRQKCTVLFFSIFLLPFSVSHYILMKTIQKELNNTQIKYVKFVVILTVHRR